jgi:anaerobic selenocysteine-containing dehydrogenase
VTTVVDGIAIKVEGADEHPPTNGVLCTKVAKYLERTYSRGTVDATAAPGRAQGGRAASRRSAWDEALDTIASR